MTQIEEIREVQLRGQQSYGADEDCDWWFRNEELARGSERASDHNPSAKELEFSDELTWLANTYSATLFVNSRPNIFQ